jgi:hypothetical protein
MTSKMEKNRSFKGDERTNASLAATPFRFLSAWKLIKNPEMVAAFGEEKGENQIR